MTSHHPPRRRGAASLVIPAALAAATLLAPTGRVLAQSAGEVYAAEELTVQPKIRNMARTASVVRTTYPVALKRAGIDGQAQVRFVIAPDGNVETGSIEVVSATVAAFGEAAKKAVEQIQFEPGKVKEAAVRTRVVLPIMYQSQ